MGHKEIILSLYRAGKQQEIIEKYIYKPIEGVSVGMVEGKTRSTLHIKIGDNPVEIY
jgi:hypothetical protein